MNAPARTALMDVAIEDVEYQRIGGRSLLARLYRPRAAENGHTCVFPLVENMNLVERAAVEVVARP